MWLFSNGEKMKRIEMIKDRDLFSKIIKKGHFVKDENYVIYYMDKDNKDDNSHFGIAIRKKIGKAHIRNRLKRQTRAIVDKNKKKFKKTYDYIIMIRNGCLKNNFESMDESMEKLLGKVTNEKK